MPPRPRRLISTLVCNFRVSRSTASRVSGSSSAARRADRSRRRQLLELAGAQPLARGALGQAHRRFRRQRGQGPRLAATQAALAQQVLHLGGQLQQAQRIGHGGATLADALPDGLMRQAEALAQAAVRLGLFDGVEIGALQILDQGELQHLLVAVDLAHHDRHLGQAGALRRAPATLAGDDHEALAVRRHDQRLHDALDADRLRELRQAGVVEVGSRLIAVRLEVAHRNRVEAESLGLEERIEAAAEAASARRHAALFRYSWASAR